MFGGDRAHASLLRRAVAVALLVTLVAGGALPPARPVRAASDPLAQVGFAPLPGFNADVWAHGGFAYVGTWGNGNDCPATGVRIIDLADPANPRVVGAVAELPGTSQEDVIVAPIATAAFTGDLLVTGVQACARTSETPRGMDLWDVSDPRAPRHLAFWESGPAGPRGAGGVHELYLFQRGDRAYVAAAVPNSELLEGRGDFRLIDVTDPRRPAQVSAWGARLNGGLRPAPGQDFFDHSAWVNRDGTLAALSYWDAGVIFLDISDPANPTFIGRTVYPPGAAGDTHSVWFAGGERILLVADEDQNPAPDGTWGFLRLFDIADPANPVEIGRFATENAASTRRDGDYSIHNPFVIGTTAYLSWYSDGIRVLDIADPRAPREIAAFVPPAAPDPYRRFQPVPQVWGVYVTGDLILASDINAGLYILRNPVPAPAPAAAPALASGVGVGARAVVGTGP